MQRIVILGNAGSGKSSLARRIGDALTLPVIHLDLLFWAPCWTESEPAAFRDRVRAALSVDRWVCEGNYARRTFDLRLPRADLVIWLDTPRSVCVRRVIWRSALRNRVALPAGCEDRLDAHYIGFLRYVWAFDRVTRPGIEARQSLHGPHVPTMRLRGPRQIEACLRALARAGDAATPRDDVSGPAS